MEVVTAGDGGIRQRCRQQARATCQHQQQDQYDRPVVFEEEQDGEAGGAAPSLGCNVFEARPAVRLGCGLRLRFVSIHDEPLPTRFGSVAAPACNGGRYACCYSSVRAYVRSNITSISVRLQRQGRPRMSKGVQGVVCRVSLDKRCPRMCPRLCPRRVPGELLQLSSRLQGRTFGAPGRPCLAHLAKDARDVHGKRERAGAVSRHSGRVLGTLAAGGEAAWPASSCAIAHRRGPLPAAPMPRTPPQHAPRRDAPWVTRSAIWPDRSSRAE
jgi:hypothetical protein